MYYNLYYVKQEFDIVDIAKGGKKHLYPVQQKSTYRYVDAHEGVNDNKVVTRTRQNNDTQRWIIKPVH
ncbi:MAG: hypothetical protein AAGB24_14910 [Bacteroidota bacterium]